MKSFSLQRNLKRLFQKNRYDEEDYELEVFNAIKVYSILIIVLGNTYYFELSGPLQNLEIVY